MLSTVLKGLFPSYSKLCLMVGVDGKPSRIRCESLIPEGIARDRGSGGDLLCAWKNAKDKGSKNNCGDGRTKRELGFSMLVWAVQKAFYILV